LYDEESVMLRDYDELPLVSEVWEDFLTRNHQHLSQTQELIRKLTPKTKKLRRRQLARLIAKARKLKNSSNKAQKAQEHDLERELAWAVKLSKTY
jgi:beta-phosphoglucomutase-like phosphatase (HAD superfamily)